MTRSVEIADLLDRAADRVDVAWCQGDLSRDDENTTKDTCPVCASGAIRWAKSGDAFGANDVAAEMAVTDNIGMLIPYWNDALGRTQAEVSAKLREVAAIERAKTAA